MDNSRLASLFQRYVEGIGTDEERQQLLQLIGESAHDKQLKALMDKLWDSLPDHQKLPPAKAEMILDNILASKGVAPRQKRIGLWNHWYRAAAAVSMILLSSATLYYFVSKDRAEQRDRVLAQQETGQRDDDHRFIRLSDGSTVILNKGSKLQYPTSFEGHANREVYLSGEAFFDIKYQSSQPFIVHTGRIKTTVLGTAFNIKAYPEEKHITVTVTRGKVKVSDDKNDFGTITSDQQISFDKEFLRAEQQQVDSRKAVAWSENDIFFDDITLADAATELEKRFGVTIRFTNDKLKTCRFTASFVKGEDLDQILHVLCEFNRAQYRNDGAGNIEIDGTGC